MKNKKVTHNQSQIEKKFNTNTSERHAEQRGNKPDMLLAELSSICCQSNDASMH